MNITERTVTVPWPPDAPVWDVTVTFADGDDGPEAVAIEFRTTDPAAHRLTTVAVRDVPVASVIREARNRIGPPPIPDVDRDAWRDELVAKVEAQRGDRPDVGRPPIPAEHLAEVAMTYTEAEAAGEPPTAAVARRFDLNRSTAGGHVQQAREHGLLPPTNRGSARA